MRKKNSGKIDKDSSAYFLVPPRSVVAFSESGTPIYEDELTEPYQNLAIAIVKQAAADYKAVYEKMLRVKSREKLLELLPEKKECEGFFRSGWYSSLTGIDGEKLMRQIRKNTIEHEKEIMKKKREE